MNAMINLSPQYDPWDPLLSLQAHGRHVLTSVEMTVTNLCNMRCEHCAVGDALVLREEKIPLSLMLRRLDEVEHLQTLSLTGGEPSYSLKTVKEYIIPLLKYARDRGIRTQLNSNVTLDYSRYEMMAPYLDVLHSSFNYVNVEDFHQVGFANAGHSVGLDTAKLLYEKMIENTCRLSKAGLFISAKSMINFRTHEKLPAIHRLIVEMGCKRHEVHPMYPSSFAANLPLLTKEQLRLAVHSLLDHREQNLWMLFGTLPFYACMAHEEDMSIIRRLAKEPNVTVRNDPDGRNRLNVSLFTGDVHVTDFSDLSGMGNIHQHKLDDIFAQWCEHPLSRTVNCSCPQALCCGPNLLVKQSYYPDIDFTSRQAIESL